MKKFIFAILALLSTIVFTNCKDKKQESTVVFVFDQSYCDINAVKEFQNDAGIDVDKNDIYVVSVNETDSINFNTVVGKEYVSLRNFDGEPFQHIRYDNVVFVDYKGHMELLNEVTPEELTEIVYNYKRSEFIKENFHHYIEDDGTNRVINKEPNTDEDSNQNKV